MRRSKLLTYGLKLPNYQIDIYQIMSPSFTLDSLAIGGGAPLFLIAGPWVIESEAHALKMAEAIGAGAPKLKMPYIFKPSHDKANRTSIKSFPPPRSAEGLPHLQ